MNSAAPASAPPKVLRLFPDATIVCIGSGPSLTQADVDYCRGKATVIAIKDAVKWAWWADVLYFSGGDLGRWWQSHGYTLEAYDGLRYTLDPKAAGHAMVLRNTGTTGIETDPSGLRTGKNSGYAAVNLAVHLGAKRVVLLGYDMQPTDGKDHFFGSHEYGHPPIPYTALRELFPSMLEPLKALGIDIVNASRRTALHCVPRMTLEQALNEHWMPDPRPMIKA